MTNNLIHLLSVAVSLYERLAPAYSFREMVTYHAVAQYTAA